MYATAQRVRSRAGAVGINGFLHVHGVHFLWPEQPWLLPERDSGAQTHEHIEVPPGGNEVISYLDVLAPDGAAPEEVEAALTGLWLELVADEAGPPAPQGRVPDPVVYQHGQVTLRLGVEGRLLGARALEVAELRRVLDPATAKWTESQPRNPRRVG